MADGRPRSRRSEATDPAIGARPGADRFDEVWDGVYVDVADRRQRASGSRLTSCTSPSIRRLERIAGRPWSSRASTSATARRVDEELSCPDVAVFLPGQSGRGSEDSLARRARLRRRGHQPLRPLPEEARLLRQGRRPGTAPGRPQALVARTLSPDRRRVEAGRQDRARPVPIARQRGPAGLLPPAPRRPPPDDRSDPAPTTPGPGSPDRPAADPPPPGPSLHERHADSLDSILGALLALALASAAEAASPRLTGGPAARRPAGDRGRGQPHRRTGWATPRRSSSISRGSRRPSSRSSPTTTSRRRSRSPPTARSGLHDLRRPDGHRGQRAADVQRRGPEGGRPRSSPTTSSPSPRRSSSARSSTAWPETEDVDYYAFEAKKGERITAEVEGARLGIALFDPYVAIMDAKRFELASSDDAALIWQDALRLGRRPGGRDVPRPGPRERLRRDRRLPLSAPRRQLPPADRDRPRRRQVRRDGRRPADRRRPGREDDPGHPARRAEARVRHRRQRRQGDRPLPQRLPALAVRQRDRGRAERRPGHGQPASRRSMALNGVIGKPEDVDHFVFPAKKGQNFNIRAFARRLRSPLDPVIYIAKKGGGVPRRQRRRAELARQHTSGSPPPRTANTSSRSPTTSRRAGPTTSTGSRSPRPSR